MPQQKYTQISSNNTQASKDIPCIVANLETKLPRSRSKRPTNKELEYQFKWKLECAVSNFFLILCLLAVSMTVVFMCFADMAQTHHYSLVNQATQSSPGAECPCGCWGCSGGRQAGQGAAGTYFLQEWHSQSPGQPPRASRWAGRAPRGAGFPHASHSTQTAAPLLSSIIQAVFPAWNKEKQWKSAVCSPHAPHKEVDETR